MNLVRVLPDVTGLDKHFDYLVPERFADRIAIGSIVRIPLHGRRVGGWVVEIDPEPGVLPGALKELTGVTGFGPDRSIIDLAAWAAWRWAGRRRTFLTAASPRTASARIPNTVRSGAAPSPRSPATTELLRTLGPGGIGIVRLPPTADPVPSVVSAVAAGPAIVVVPEVATARLLGARLRRSGLTVAVVPDEWADAAGGVDVVIGTRTAAWAPCPGLAVAMVLDEHDEALQSEASPTWHARDVLAERCRRAAVPLVLVSPVPTLHALALTSGAVVHPAAARERSGWPIIDVIDRSDEVPWKRSLLTSELIRHLREPDRRVVCVSNTTGRARLLACRSCRALARCERCEAAVVLDDDERLVCPSCATARPAVCTQCRSTSFANLRPGVTRLREELEAAAGRPVAVVTGADDVHDPDAPIVVGTEAVLHRVPRADVVAFLDLDRELLAPRYRAVEQTAALIVRAARLVGSRRGGGRVLLQTFLPDHPLVRAFVLGDPGRLVGPERERREVLELPPVAALASIGGAGGDAFVETLTGVEVGGTGDGHLVRAPSWSELADALRAGSRPPGLALRVAVDPPRM